MTTIWSLLLLLLLLLIILRIRQRLGVMLDKDDEESDINGDADDEDNGFCGGLVMIVRMTALLMTMSEWCTGAQNITKHQSPQPHHCSKSSTVFTATRPPAPQPPLAASSPDLLVIRPLVISCRSRIHHIVAYILHTSLPPHNIKSVASLALV